MSEYVAHLRNSDELAAVLNEVNAVVLQECDRDPVLQHVDTRYDDDTTIVMLECRDDDAGPDGFDGYDEVVVEGRFRNDTLTRVEVTHEYQVGPLAGGGTRYRHDGETVSVEPLWIS